MDYENEDIVSIIDFSKPSTEKRLFIIDLKDQNLLHHTLVAHGKNTGQNKAEKFSNVRGSNASSLGLFRTAEPYYGKHGYSLRLDGLEKGFNDNARSLKPGRTDTADSRTKRPAQSSKRRGRKEEWMHFKTLLIATALAFASIVGTTAIASAEG